MKKLLLALILISSLPVHARKPQVAKVGSIVRVEYVGKVDDGIIFDTNLGQAPLSFVVGDGTVLKGFEDGVTGLKVGEKTTLSIPAEYAYGAVNINKIFKVARAQVPADIPLAEGTNLTLQGPNGIMLVRVVEVTDKEVVLDANHLLAGKDLSFEVKLLSAEPPVKAKS